MVYMDSWDAEPADPTKKDEIVLASTELCQPADLNFPLDFVREKIFLTGNQPCRSSIRLF